MSRSSICWTLEIFASQPIECPTNLSALRPPPHSSSLVLTNQRYKVGPDAGMKLQWEKFMEDFGRVSGQVGMFAANIL
jgi:hypothetical protein